MTATMRKPGQADALVNDEIAALTPAQRTLLASMIGKPFTRVKNGWRRPGDRNLVTLATMDRLLNRKLVTNMTPTGQAALTWHGKVVAQEIRARKKAKGS